jgi:hypothetical protein
LASGRYAEGDLFTQSMKLTRAMRRLIGKDMIAHLGLEYYD